MQLDVKLGEFVLLDDASVVQITKRTLVYNVADRKTLDGLVLRRLASAAIADNLVRVVAAMSVTTVIAALDSHDGNRSHQSA